MTPHDLGQLALLLSRPCCFRFCCCSPSRRGLTLRAAEIAWPTTRIGRDHCDAVAGTLLFNALREAIDEEMGRDPHVCVMGEDVGHCRGSYKVTKDLAEKYGDLRVLDTPIAENGFTGMAVGAAMTGLRPIVEGMNMGFLLLAFNQISNNMGMLRYTAAATSPFPLWCAVPVVWVVSLALSTANGRGLLPCRPGIKIVACSTPTNAKGLMKAAIQDNNPALSSSTFCSTTSVRSSPKATTPVPLTRRTW